MEAMLSGWVRWDIPRLEPFLVDPALDVKKESKESKSQRKQVRNRRHGSSEVYEYKHGDSSHPWTQGLLIHPCGLGCPIPQGQGYLTARANKFRSF